MLTGNKSTVLQKVRKELLKRARKGIVSLHSRDIHHLFEKGLGSCSIDRYIRLLRQRGEIEYEDPRKNRYIYKIKITDKFIREK